MISLIFLSLSLIGSIVRADDDLLVKTNLGYVQGHYNYLGVREWNGIPYAKPPVENLRWEYPQTPNAYDGTYVANFMAPGCPQVCNLPPGNCPEYGTSEDCLYLSVWSPSKPSSDPSGYPVLLWIHGGAFEQGLGDCALYNGTNFAQKDVITVAINYRLGALGFLASSSMRGNYGLMDQRLAMQWTYDNIASFGGDNSKITLAGQSAGAMSVGSHLTSPGSKGLFSKAIMESNPLALPYHDRTSATQNANDVFEYCNCTADDVSCMRTRSVDEILDAQNHAIKLNFDNLFINFLPFAPLVEPNGELPQQPFYAMMHGELTQMPVLAGSVYDEGQLFVYELFTKPMSEPAYNAAINAIFTREKAKEILKMYPFDIVPGSTDGREALNVLGTDLLFYCPLRNQTMGYQSALGQAAIPTYIYRFKHIMSFDCWGANYTFCVGKVCHGSELPFVFNVFTDGVSVDYAPNPDELQLTIDVANAWTNFITNGDPNSKLAVPVSYPLYDTIVDALTVVDEPDPSVQSQVRDSFCDMWDRLGYFY